MPFFSIALNTLLFILSLAFCTPTFATVYRCVHPETKAVTYQDSVCTLANTENKTLAIDLQLPIPKKNPTQQGQKQPPKNRAARSDKQQKEKLKAEKRERWRQQRCESSRRQKTELLDRLRHGYTAKSEYRLKFRLHQIELKEAKYCVKSH